MDSAPHPRRRLAYVSVETQPKADSASYTPVNTPQHVAIIMDGNHRWAYSRKLPSELGHRRGAKNVRPIAEACADAGVKHLTLFAFSTENWNRPKAEVDLLMELIHETLRNDVSRLNEKDTRLRFIGDRRKFPIEIQTLMTKSEYETQDNKSMVLTIALNYGGRWDITQATQQLALDVQEGRLDASSVDEGTLESYMSNGGLQPPDLCIRTGGDRRLSNFLLWDIAYTELYFTDRFWPEFRDVDLQLALAAYSARQRRFGQRELASPTRAVI